MLMKIGLKIVHCIFKKEKINLSQQLVSWSRYDQYTTSLYDTNRRIEACGLWPPVDLWKHFFRYSGLLAPLHQFHKSHILVELYLTINTSRIKILTHFFRETTLTFIHTDT